MAFQQSDLAVIERAIASGTMRVKYADKEVTYNSMDDLLKARDLIKTELGQKAKSQRMFARHNKGLGS
jgi:hypothetical protein